MNMGEAEILSIAKLMKSGKWDITGETVGLIFPCFYGTMPQLIGEFISRADTIESDYIYSVVSAGGDPGYSLKHLKEALMKKDSDLHYGRKITIASNYMNGWYYSLIQPDRETIEKNAISARQKCSVFTEDIHNRFKLLEKSNYLNFIMPQTISPSRYIRDTRPWDSEFSISPTCNSCGICVNICPVDNIIMKEGKPTFSRNCQRCMGCVQICSQSAFKIEGKAMIKQKYIHPMVGKKELIDFNS